MNLLRPVDLVSEISANAYVQSLLERVDTSPDRLDADFSNGPVGIVGGGLMGTAIAATHLKNGCGVVLCEQSEAVLDALSEKIAAELTLQGEHENAPQIVREHIVLTRNPGDLKTCEILIESIPEKIRLKHKLYRTLEALGFRGLLLTNTSTIEVSRLAANLAAPDRFCGFHFFHPVRNRSLLEIVRGSHTSQETIRTAKEHAQRLDKIPLVVEDRPGFLVNRLLNPLLRETLAMLDEGVPPQRIETAALRFGMPMGPIRIMDEIGLDVTLHAGWVLNQAFPERAYQSEILLKLIDAGRLGRKTGLGFMRYPTNVSWENEGEFDGNLIAFLPPERDEFDGDEIARRLFLPMFCEAVRAVEENVVRNPWEADLAVVLGLGFPGNRGGLFYWAESLGLEFVLDSLRRLEAEHGPRLSPPTSLVRFVESNRCFLRDWQGQL